MVHKKFFSLLAALALLLGTLALPVPEGLGVAGRNTLGLLLAALVLWVTEAVPLAVTALALIILQPVYGVADLNDAFKEFISPVIFFVIASYGISASIMKTPLAYRMAKWLLVNAGNNTAKIILAFTIGPAVLSAFVSNVPAAALFMGLALSILDALGAKPGSSRLGKALMIAIPFGAMIGGIATPSGSSINILVLYLLDKYVHVNISFLDWIFFGLPIAVVMVPISSYVIVKVFKPEALGLDVAAVLKGMDTQKHLTLTEKKVITILGLMMIFWLASTWITAINITMVAIAGLILFFVPGINVLSWDEFSPEVGWDAVIMIGGVTSIGAAVVSSGLSTWFLNEILQNLVGLGVVPLTALIGMIINLLHLLLPIGPAIVTISIQPLADLSVLAGISPAIFAITTAFLAGCCMLLPLDAVPLITYNKKFYTMWDMFKSGLITSTVWVLVTAVWVPVVAFLTGY
ncbi:solute carrier family 13 (sodium-dependent dicarboxylate transporter), member 2/3/5 [Desulfotomaculum arcticum]|uniref:Solute carrier family 13 (Sodium-dependent dicarboxylate transporter), member 2/3/5 n=1 Tax=Desulfotruncus arcticus DSM 17038 TaxID=1121424 RepID=A0A1I2NY33_9FIRM|nr:SLC13 family permease [Desulfotruncus arcticus]SFG07970.1 solute carrier family 13 (sodium-dependent dicarboxylate transporter), member 2/3/5 [Desulfotomaculum arcticum] [Desulfotruncus arcticus DSM 17038]